ncbi:hypothetical protein QQF64_020501 [Cirrhinus molitorella]|uniref:Reverse transcriptase/retrotransposon-derived protein RNase H-like domain-containing protein n=1 Tax=Cirrhinus molitorella TaxID=172907 RepID=A0ABR3LBP7_9TELE
MNVLKRCYQELFGRLGPVLFESSDVVGAPRFVSQALQYCSNVNTVTNASCEGPVRVRGRRACRIPGGMLKLVPATCSKGFSKGVGLFEPYETGLPAGLLASPAVAQVSRGIAYIPDVLLYPRIKIGHMSSVYVVSLPTGVTEVQPVVATSSAQHAKVRSIIQEQIAALDLSNLSVVEQGQKRISQGFVEAWTEQCQVSFEGLKRKLSTALVLAYADFTRPFILEVDASHSGLGAVLSQDQGDRVRPIAYASCCLRPTERNMTNYSSMKLELVALKWAMAEKFREYLLGQKCIVFTDNNPLSHLTSAKLGAAEQCWAAQLASFDFELRY